ncbi:hypothetical protein ACHWWK_07265 [Klebsiella pneumoniae]
MLHTISRQRATFIFIITLLCFIGLFSPVQGRAADLPDRAEVQSQLNTLNKQKELTPQDKLVQQDLTQTLETLDKNRAYQKRDGTAATAGRAGAGEAAPGGGEPQ